MGCVSLVAIERHVEFLEHCFNRPSELAHPRNNSRGKCLFDQSRRRRRGPVQLDIDGIFHRLASSISIHLVVPHLMRDFRWPLRWCHLNRGVQNARRHVEHRGDVVSFCESVKCLPTPAARRTLASCQPSPPSPTSPDEGQGLARDMRVRWALEEVGMPYDVRLVPMAELKHPDHRARNPFGQIPTFEQGGLTLFESGAIILHIAAAHPGLLPDDPDARARAIMWMFAALNTVEPPIVELEIASYFEADKPWREEHAEMLKDRVRARLTDLAAFLGDRDWLEGSFSVGDLMMVLVLRRLEGTGVIEEYRTIAAYIARGEARPAYQRAFAAQNAVWESSR